MASSSAASATAGSGTMPTMYLIRHGEKPSNDEVHGLSDKGGERAAYLPQVFGPTSNYNIAKIMAQHPKKSGSEDRPYQTVKPLADSLELDVDKSIHRDDISGAVADAMAFVQSGPAGNLLICWEHKELGKIAQALGVTKYSPNAGPLGHGAIVYPGDHFDLIWVVPYPYDEISEIRSEQVPGLDS